MNQLGVIYPYNANGLWVFDDPNVGLMREPFIAGIDTMLDQLTAEIKDAKNGFRLIFSGAPFPGFTMQLNWIEEDKPLTKGEVKLGYSRGNWYVNPETGAEGWLCPALLKYFSTAPKNLYVKLEEAVGQRPVYRTSAPAPTYEPPVGQRGSDSWIERQIRRISH